MPRLLDTIGDYVQEKMDIWQIPGVALGVIHNDEIIHCEGYGLRNVAEKLPVTADTTFAIASVTKSFTAMGVALLVDKGILEWDKPIRHYMPEFKLADSYISDHITIRDMLSHRSGLPRHDLAWYGNDFTRTELVHNVRYHAFSKGFREVLQYSNLMYVVAGYLCGQLMGMTWEEYIQTHIFNELGMTRSCFDAEDMLEWGDYALPYRVNRQNDNALELMEYYANSVMGPAGSIHSNLNDLMTWMRVHLNEGQLDDLAFISSGNLTQMHTPQMVVRGAARGIKIFGTRLFSYGMGWGIRPHRGHTIVEHNGSINGFRSMASFVPEKKLGVIVLSNLWGFPSLPEYLPYEIIDRVLSLDDYAWHTKIFTFRSEILAAEDQEKDTNDEDQVLDTQPSHPLADYAGLYAADGYADFKVEFEDDHLYGWLGGERSELRHYHYDVFRLRLKLFFEGEFPIQFSLDMQGNITTAIIPLEPEVDAIHFSRKPPELSTEDLANLAGEYDMPLDGYTLRITLRESQVYCEITGFNTREIIPRSQKAGKVEFVFKEENEANRIEFILDDNGQASEAIVKHLGMVHKSPRLN